MKNIQQEYYAKFSRSRGITSKIIDKIDRREPAFSDLLRHFSHAEKLLDVGCGSGRFLRAAENFFECTGIDESRVAINMAKKVTLKSNLIRDGYLQHDFGKNTWQIITMFDVLEHVAGPNLFLAKACQEMTPQAWLVVSVPNIDSIANKLKGELWWGQADPSHLNLWATVVWEEMMQKAGFRILKKVASGLINYPKPPYKLTGWLKIGHEVTQGLAITGIPLPHRLNDLNIWISEKL